MRRTARLVAILPILTTVIAWSTAGAKPVDRGPRGELFRSSVGRVAKCRHWPHLGHQKSVASDMKHPRPENAAAR